MERRHPPVDFDLEPSWIWMAWKFGYDMNDIFGTLHEEYNTVPAPIQDMRSFHRDVKAIAEKAENKKDFCHLLSQNKINRLGYIASEWKATATLVMTTPESFECGNRERLKNAFSQFCQFFSYETLIHLTQQYLPIGDPDSRQQPNLLFNGKTNGSSSPPPSNTASKVAQGTTDKRTKPVKNSRGLVAHDCDSIVSVSGGRVKRRKVTPNRPRRRSQRLATKNQSSRLENAIYQDRFRSIRGS
ncbi:hypothetical protein BX600DRAFT_515449 [Xylariales sp. PMI_506]|nr:hypothetical protein BX600DRAFT_515449 [Xylariales sp. PMI_506]